MMNQQKDPKIENRESWLKLILISFFSVAITIKVFLTPIGIINFQFMDLLNLTLALFAIGMSVAFYYKANDTSNQFYDNTYKFTQDMSEILGRIESGFGERLKHLDEGYLSIRERVEKISIDPDKVEKEIEREKERVAKAEREKEDVIKELMDRANLAEGEKKSILSDLISKDNQVSILKAELAALREKLQDAYVKSNMHRPAARAFMKTLINNPDLDFKSFDLKLWSKNLPEAKSVFTHMNINSFTHEQLIKCGFLKEDKTLTDVGLQVARDIVFQRTHAD